MSAQFIKTLLLALLMVAPAFLSAQLQVLEVAPAKTVTVKAGATSEASLSLKVTPGYHVNSNTPSDPYLIPLRLTWTNGTVETSEIVFPKPRNEKYSFSEKPLSVFTGDFEIVTRLKAAASVSPGAASLKGKLHYQACNDHECLAPRTIDVTLPIEIVK
jgi:thiol:disulfide interchange protein DsbD